MRSSISTLTFKDASTLSGGSCKLNYMNTLQQRFAEAVRSAGITNLAELARDIGVEPAAIYAIRDGKTKTLAAETAIRLSRRTGARVEYLVLGELPKKTAEIRSAAQAESESQVENDVDEITLAFVVLADWIRQTRPVEAPALHAGLMQALSRLQTTEDSPLRLMAQALTASPEAGFAAKKSQKQNS